MIVLSVLIIVDLIELLYYRNHFDAILVAFVITIAVHICVRNDSAGGLA